MKIRFYKNDTPARFMTGTLPNIRMIWVGPLFISIQFKPLDCEK